jgi:DNA-binding phage protein
LKPFGWEDHEWQLSRPLTETALPPDGNPEFSTIMKVIRALGLRLRGAPVHG